VDVSKFERLRNPFSASNASGLRASEQEQLIDISCDSSLKDTFDADELPQFWLLVKNSYLSISDKLVQILLLFMTTYLGKSGSSAPVMKTKYSSQLIIVMEIQVAISSMTSQLVNCKLRNKLINHIKSGIYNLHPQALTRYHIIGG
jgi:hypothetical protein